MRDPWPHPHYDTERQPFQGDRPAMSFLLFDPFPDPGSFSLLLSVLEENTFPHLDRTKTLSGKEETSRMQKGSLESGVINFIPILPTLRKSCSSSLPPFT